MNTHNFQVNLCLNVYYENNVPKEINTILINNGDCIDTGLSLVPLVVCTSELLTVDVWVKVKHMRTSSGTEETHID